jgi:hypothetical protein
VFVHGSARTCRVLKVETSVISIYDSEEYMQKTTNTSYSHVCMQATACALCVRYLIVCVFVHALLLRSFLNASL